MEISLIEEFELETSCSLEKFPFWCLEKQVRQQILNYSYRPTCLYLIQPGANPPGLPQFTAEGGREGGGDLTGCLVGFPPFSLLVLVSAVGEIMNKHEEQLGQACNVG